MQSPTLKNMHLQQQVGINYILLTILAVAFTWLLHEFSHWLTGELLGNNMAMTLNSSYPLAGKYGAASHANLVSIAGPLVTLLQAVIIYYLLKSGKAFLLFPFLLTCLYMRVMAAGLNFINLNDEGRVSQSLQLGTFTLPLLISAILFYLVYAVVKQRQLSSRMIIITTLLVMFVSSIMIYPISFCISGYCKEV
ncbi:hypothetical protein [Pontibacter arcticus]|uniref:Peptidase M50B-like n=1 Tax=Pontibacter arcticus TaxID=2080288 RepID=A0A364RDN4_9BACT|nr:hypothetical protein [Pontibacter arcticus]RAU82460.1 hypothetical protein DP923_11795 [Pontibacter arcticus]